MVRAFAIALLVAGLSAASAVVSGPVRAQTPSAEVEPKPIGKVVSAGGSVTIEHATAVVVQAAAGGSGQAKVGDFVYQGDLVQTGADSAVGIAFTDGTAFNVASNARIVLNEFVYNPKGKSNSTLFTLSKGTLTFVAGKVAKTGSMKIDTPVATMGIRGTTPRIEIGEDGSVAFSTLVEEQKNSVRDRRGALVAPSGQRETNKVESQRGKPAAAPADKNLDVILKICRGC